MSNLSPEKRRIKKWQHSIVVTMSEGAIRVVPEADYRKIMAVYRAAVKMSNTPFVTHGATSTALMVALDKVVTKAEK